MFGALVVSILSNPLIKLRIPLEMQKAREEGVEEGVKTKGNRIGPFIRSFDNHNCHRRVLDAAFLLGLSICTF